MKRKRIERYKNADKTQRDAIYRYTPADKNTKMPPPPQYIPILCSHPHQDNFISMAFCPQETLFSGIALKPTTIRTRPWQSLVNTEHSTNFCNKDCKANYHSITTVPSLFRALHKFL